MSRFDVFSGLQAEQVEGLQAGADHGTCKPKGGGPPAGPAAHPSDVAAPAARNAPPRHGPMRQGKSRGPNALARISRNAAGTATPAPAGDTEDRGVSNDHLIPQMAAAPRGE
jgi:hypothetical protein